MVPHPAVVQVRSRTPEFTQAKPTRPDADADVGAAAVFPSVTSGFHVDPFEIEMRARSEFALPATQDTPTIEPSAATVGMPSRPDASPLVVDPTVTVFHVLPRFELMASLIDPVSLFVYVT